MENMLRTTAFHTRFASMTWRMLRLVCVALLLFALYQLILGKGSLLDRLIDDPHRADTFVRQQLLEAEPGQQVADGVYVPASAAELKNGSYQDAVERVAKTVQLVDDRDQAELRKQSSAFISEYGALSAARIAQMKKTYAQASDKVEIENKLRAFLKQRDAELDPLPSGLSRAEVYNVACALTVQIGSLPLRAVRDGANGGTLRIIVTDDGSKKNEMYGQGSTVATTFRQSHQTSMQISYVPKRDYPTLGIEMFEGTVAHELAHVLNLDIAATQSNYVAAANVQHFSASNTFASIVTAAGFQRFAGTPRYESVYAQSEPLEDVAETVRAVLMRDVYSPDDVRAFESLLGVKKLQVLAELEYRFPGFTSYMYAK